MVPADNLPQVAEVSRQRLRSVPEKGVRPLLGAGE
jgi:hypothetical protein